MIFHFPHRISLELNEKSFSHCFRCFYLLFFLKCRPFAEVECGVRLTAVQMPITRESQAWDFFRFPKQQMRFFKSRSRVLVELALVGPKL